MKYFICNNCHYLFSSDIQPQKCPACSKEQVPGTSADNCSFIFPAIREASDAEISSYEAALNEVKAAADMLTWAARLDSYGLSDDEYNTALILLYAFKNCPGYYTARALLPLISIHGSIHADSDIARASLDMYTAHKKGFISNINQERRSVGTNDTGDVAYYSGKDSASSVLMQFKQDPFDEIVGKVPNLGNIRRINLAQVASMPGKGYLRFIRDWYNSLDQTPPYDIISSVR